MHRVTAMLCVLAVSFSMALQLTPTYKWSYRRCSWTHQAKKCISTPLHRPPGTSHNMASSLSTKLNTTAKTASHCRKTRTLHVCCNIVVMLVDVQLSRHWHRFQFTGKWRIHVVTGFNGLDAWCLSTVGVAMVHPFICRPIIVVTVMTLKMVQRRMAGITKTWMTAVRSGYLCSKGSERLKQGNANMCEV